MRMRSTPSATFSRTSRKRAASRPKTPLNSADGAAAQRRTSTSSRRCAPTAATAYGWARYLTDMRRRRRLSACSTSSRVRWTRYELRCGHDGMRSHGNTAGSLSRRLPRRQPRLHGRASHALPLGVRVSHLLHKVMPGIRTTGALHKGERHKSFPERLGPGYRPPAPLQKGERHKSFPERLGPGYRPPVPCKRVSVISHFLHKVMPGIQTTGALQKGERHQSSPAQGYARDTDHRCPAQG